MVVAALAVIVVAILTLHIPYFAITPGPASDVLQLIEIRGAKTNPVRGRLMLTTVSLHEARVAEAVRSWIDKSYLVLPRSVIIPPGETEQDADRRTTEQMDRSQEHAAAAALTFLGYEVKNVPLGARVTEFPPNAPAREVLRTGDVIVGADTSQVQMSKDLVAVIQRHKVGDAISLKVKRDDRTLTVTTKTVGGPDEASEPVIGVYLEDAIRTDLPLAVDIDSLGIGGPSAGLMYALGIVDLLDESDLTKGRTIAGTGAITIKGDVEPVGGVQQKVAAAREIGADLFVVPVEELREACAGAGTMSVVGVEALTDAVRSLSGAPTAPGRTCG